MPSNLKKRVRSRMEKTGESWETARRQVEAKKGEAREVPPPYRPLWDRFDEMVKSILGFVREHPGADLYCQDNPKTLRIGWLASVSMMPGETYSRSWEIGLTTIRGRRGLYGDIYPSYLTTSHGRKALAQIWAEGREPTREYVQPPPAPMPPEEDEPKEVWTVKTLGPWLRSSKDTGEVMRYTYPWDGRTWSLDDSTRWIALIGPCCQGEKRHYTWSLGDKVNGRHVGGSEKTFEAAKTECEKALTNLGFTWKN